MTTACSFLFRSLGSVIGLSLSATVIQQSLRTNLKKALGSGPAAEKIERDVRRSLANIDTLDPGVAQIVRDSYGLAIRHGFVLMIGICSFALVGSFFIKEKRLSR